MHHVMCTNILVFDELGRYYQTETVSNNITEDREFGLYWVRSI